MTPIGGALGDEHVQEVPGRILECPRVTRRFTQRLPGTQAGHGISWAMRIGRVAACIVTPVLLASIVQGQTTTSDPQTPPYEETIDVVAVTPIHGLGIPRDPVPANLH